MHLITYQVKDQSRCGLLLNNQIVDLQRACNYYSRAARLPYLFPDKGWTISLADFLTCGPDAIRLFQKAVTFIQQEGAMCAPLHYKQGILAQLDEGELLAPILRPGKIICVGGNYPGPDPSKNTPQYPTLFLKPSSSITGQQSAILLPPATQNVAYEVELAVVIGQRAKYLTPERAFACVAGYTLANDIGDRDLEKRTSQWTTGKLMDTFTPLGPVLVTRDEIEDPGHLEMHTLLNGQVVQKGNTSQMIFNISTLISYISSLTTLEPGDVILTGCPKMMGDHPAPAIALKPGDRLEINIEKIGCLTNTVQSETIL